MDCNEARPLLDANADHELPAPDARRVQQHIESCEACRRESENLGALRGALRAATYHRAPQSLRARILAGLPEMEEVVAAEPLTATGAADSAIGQPRNATERPSTAIGQPITATSGSGIANEQPGVATERPGAAIERPGAAIEGPGVVVERPGGAIEGPSAAADDPRTTGRQADSEMDATRAPSRPRRRRSWFAGWLDGWRLPSGGFGQPIGMGGMGGGSGASRLLAPGWLAVLAVALCAGVAVATLNLTRPAELSPFADELVESHVRAQVSGRDIDVISTDKHTVKPWFNGRLDYSPPVEDLAASGFPLEGGRLDYLAHQRVGVLVYHYRKHVIDVYVFPQAGSGGTGHDTPGAAPTATATLEREGYSIAHWNAAGMTWWAITDAAPDALTGLEAALKARLQSGSERSEGS
ncbi:zf-HC2 domain-containing protein [Paraburkholderia bryophila]|uniref:zf-HC2 domain-containing protein n=1 Tax=Paraburkholderia bryophila TaxID=420952 RepID=UPI00234B2AF2|nr:zf-HC2 domain-containing protein [Paraburkholderia bryophila]WCM21467.1 zf-HC2 domain-containing protein [Paraburkholderia bryophila]